MSEQAPYPVLDRILGQPEAVRLLRASVANPLHAYLFLGPPGTGRRAAAIAFAASLFCPRGGCGECEVCQATLSCRHPDLVVVERLGASILVPQAQEVVRLASLTPRAAPYQVLVLLDFHLIGSASPVLLKTIEEPPATTVIVVTAESVPADFVTIASRCARVDFHHLSEEDLASFLVSQEGVDEAQAAAVAKAAQGRLDRAAVLARDEGYSARLARWREVPSVLDGSGATAASLAADLVAAANAPAEVVKRRQAEELERLAEEAGGSGERVAARAETDARHRREQRRARTDDLRAGLGALAAAYRARLGASQESSRTAVRAVELIDEAASRLALNVNETLLLEWLFVELAQPGQPRRAF